MARRTPSKSSRGAGKGNQEPQIAREPAFVSSDGDDAAELVAAYGYNLDPWQRRVITSWLGRDKRDKFTAKTAGLCVPRQNGKNAIIEVRELYGLVCMGENILHTAHEVKTARKAFIRLASFFENERQYPELANMVASIRRTNGQEAIEMKNGGSVEFSARSRGAARGFTVDVVVFDEAQELSDEQSEALVPTLAASPHKNRQFIYTGTPTPPGCPAHVFEDMRIKAHEGKTKSLAWHEWSIEDCIKPTDTFEDVKELIKQTNPALGYRLEMSHCQDEFTVMSHDGFSRERLGWWAPTAHEVDCAIPREAWKETIIEPAKVPQNGKRACGVKFSPDGATVALSAAVKPEDAPVYFELLRVENTSCGVSWLSDWLVERKDKISTVVVDGFSGADALVERMGDKVPKGYITRPRTGDVIAAAATFLDALKAKSITHIRSAAIDNVAKNVTKRRIGNRGGWGFAGLDANVIDSAALAVWGANNTKRDPEQRQVIY